MTSLHELSRDELVAVAQTQMERIAALEAEVQSLRAQLKARGTGSTPPAFVKPNRAVRLQGEPRTRQKRAHGFVRKREERTEVAVHAVAHCPDCGHTLAGGWVHDTRQTIELPEAPVRIIEHVLLGRWCGRCRRRHIPTLGPADGVFGQRRVGPRLMSAIVMLSKVCRMPVRTIQRTLQALYGLHLSTGEVCEVLHAVAARGKDEAADILSRVRQAPVVHGDETGWREDGLNGWVWSFSTPLLRYFEIARSRAAAVPQRILSGMVGTLVTDFYAAYNWYEGPHSRCWVHLLRDLKELKQTHAGEAEVTCWVDAVVAVHKEAESISWEKVAPKQREGATLAYEERLLALARPHLGNKESAQHALAWRINQYHKELFHWVRDPSVPSHNNAAERALRPVVVGRKVSGGTRSAKGSHTTSTLLTLLGTWMAQGKEPIEACMRLLAGIPPTAPVAPT